MGAQALGRLKPQEVRCLLLRAEGYSYREICAETGWTYTKVNRCLTEGRRAFLERLAGIESGAECERLAPAALRPGRRRGRRPPTWPRCGRTCAPAWPAARGCASTARCPRGWRRWCRSACCLPPPATPGRCAACSSGRSARCTSAPRSSATGRQQAAELAVGGKVAAVAASAAALAGGGAADGGAPQRTGRRGGRRARRPGRRRARGAGSAGAGDPSREPQRTTAAAGPAPAVRAAPRPKPAARAESRQRVRARGRSGDSRPAARCEGAGQERVRARRRDGLGDRRRCRRVRALILSRGACPPPSAPRRRRPPASRSAPPP